MNRRGRPQGEARSWGPRTPRPVPGSCASFALLLVASLLSGCSGEQVETAYGRSRDRSLNGTGALVELFRDRGHTVRTAVRLSDELGEWADVIVRFSPRPGPPEEEEADWYFSWLSELGDRQMIYVVRDYSALADYWQEVLDHLPSSGADTERSRAKQLRDDAVSADSQKREWPKQVARPEDWFDLNRPKDPPTACKTLEGPWSEGVDPARARLSRHETFKVEAERVLLEGDGQALVMDWTLYNQSRVLAVANGSFLLNGALLLPARRPLASYTVDWVGEEPLNVAFVDGRAPLSSPSADPSVFALLKIHPFGWVVAQFLLLGLAACLARAPRLGRARQEASTGEDRPVAHPEALGALLARAGDIGNARLILDAYRRWRNVSGPARLGLAPVAPLPSPPASVDRTGQPSQSESPEHE